MWTERVVVQLLPSQTKCFGFNLQVLLLPLRIRHYHFLLWQLQQLVGRTSLPATSVVKSRPITTHTVQHCCCCCYCSCILVSHQYLDHSSLFSISYLPPPAERRKRGSAIKVLERGWWEESDTQSLVKSRTYECHMTMEYWTDAEARWRLIDQQLSSELNKEQFCKECWMNEEQLDVTIRLFYWQ